MPAARMRSVCLGRLTFCGDPSALQVHFSTSVSPSKASRPNDVCLESVGGPFDSCWAVLPSSSRLRCPNPNEACLSNFDHLGAGSRSVFFLAGFLRSPSADGRLACFFALCKLQGDSSGSCELGRLPQVSVDRTQESICSPLEFLRTTVRAFPVYVPRSRERTSTNRRR